MKKRFIPVVLLVAAAVAGALWWQQRSRDAAADSRTFHGNVDIRDVGLAFRVGGRVAEIAVQEGDTVAPGQLIARLDDEPYRWQLHSAQAAVDQARANSDRLRAGFRPEEIAQAEATLAARQATLQRAVRDFARARQLRTTDANTPQALDQAESVSAEAAAQLKVARANLDLLKAGNRAEDIAGAQAQLAQAEARLAELKLNLADTTLVAPSTGTILTRAIEPGAMVGAGQTAFTLTLTDRTWVRAYVAEPQLGLIHPGQRVSVYTDSRDQPYAGQIGFISPTAEFTPKNVETADLRSALVFRFRVILDASDQGLRQGMPVSVVPDENEAR